METLPIRAYLVDDEMLAIERLGRLLAGFANVRVIGSATDPAEALDFLNRESTDVLFLDIQMPGMNGFELLSQLAEQPCVIFTTAYDEYALKAFEVNSIDYLLKPIEASQLERALAKLSRLRPISKPDWLKAPELHTLLSELAASLRGPALQHHAQTPQPAYPTRIASRVGERVSFLELGAVTHFLAQDKLTFAIVNGHKHCVDPSIAELERRLDPAKFLRIHRAVLLNVDWIQEVHSSFAGKLLVSLRDAQHTQLPVARDRMRELKSRMGF
jgi:two-component system LytT family response regulator